MNFDLVATSSRADLTYVEARRCVETVPHNVGCEPAARALEITSTLVRAYRSFPELRLEHPRETVAAAWLESAWADRQTVGRLPLALVLSLTHWLDPYGCWPTAGRVLAALPAEERALSAVLVHHLPPGQAAALALQAASDPHVDGASEAAGLLGGTEPRPHGSAIEAVLALRRSASIADALGETQTSASRSRAYKAVVDARKLISESPNFKTSEGDDLRRQGAGRYSNLREMLNLLRENRSSGQKTSESLIAAAHHGI